MYGQPPPPRPRKKTGFGRVLFVLMVLGFAGFYIYRTLVPPGIPTGVISAGTRGFNYSGDALIVRNETPYDEEGVSRVQYRAEEGSVVYPGDLICLVYSSGYSQKEVTTLQNFRDQIRSYQLSLIATESTFDTRMSRLETEVLNKAREVRQMVQGFKGNMLNMERSLDTSIALRQDYLREKYRDDTRLARLYDDESTQEKRIQSYTKQRAATRESLVSFYTDGYEGLNPGNFEEYSPAQVRAMINGQRPEKTAAQRGRTTIYRLVRQNGWGVLLLLKDTKWTPTQGKTYQLKLEQFENTVVNATVLSYTRAGGELLLRLSVTGDVSPVLFMRTCQAEIGENVSSMVVPAKAIWSQRDPNTGELKTGVVIFNGLDQAFVPVKVLSSDGNEAHIEPELQGILYVGQPVRLF